jgi:hypothetical protein
LAWEMGMSSVSIELDCKLVIKGIGDRTTNQFEFGKFIHECKMLFSIFSNFKISLVRRQINFMLVVVSLIIFHLVFPTF